MSNALIEISPASNIKELVKNIEDFEKIKVCHGGPSLAEFPNVPTSLCSVSTIGRLKHYQCLVVLKGDTKSCTRCKRLRNVLVMRKKRKSTMSKEILKLSPTKKIIVDRLRRTKCYLKKNVLELNK